MHIDQLQIGHAKLFLTPLCTPQANCPKRKRELETEAVGRLLIAAELSPSLLRHTSQGAPYIDSSHAPFISISHSKGLAAIALSPSPVGIDIERIGPRTTTILARITQPRERHMLTLPIDAAQATRVWCAKEAAFKLYSSQAKTITDITLTTCSITQAQSETPQPARIEFREIGEYVLAIATPLVTNRQGT